MNQSSQSSENGESCIKRFTDQDGFEKQESSPTQSEFPDQVDSESDVNGTNESNHETYEFQGDKIEVDDSSTVRQRDAILVGHSGEPSPSSSRSHDSDADLVVPDADDALPSIETSFKVIKVTSL